MRFRKKMKNTFSDKTLNRFLFFICSDSNLSSSHSNRSKMYNKAKEQNLPTAASIAAAVAATKSFNMSLASTSTSSSSAMPHLRDIDHFATEV